MMNKRYPAIVILLFLAACIPQPGQETAETSAPPALRQAADANSATLRRQAEEALADYRFHSAADKAHRLKQQTGTLPPHLQRVLDDYGPMPEIICTSCTFGLAERDLADLTAKARQGDTKAAGRLAAYYAFETNDMAQFEYWNRKAGAE